MNQEYIMKKTQIENADIDIMSALTSKGGIRNKKVIAYLEKCVYPDMKIALSEVNLFMITVIIHSL
jgi:hypothetical protein